MIDHIPNTKKMKNTYKIGRVEDLHLPDLAAAGVGEVAVVIVNGESTQTLAVGRRVPDRV